MRSILKWFPAFVFVVMSCENGFAQKMITPGENLVIDGVPAISSGIAEQVRKYTESRSAAFADWHPTKREMLISTRFGNTPQLHEIRMPGGARRQLTFLEEPVQSATWEPKNGEYFVFSRDTGGNEFGQLYRFDVATGDVALLTDGGRSQNGGIVWNRAKTQFVYGTTRRNGADRDLWLMDPLRPEASRALVELSGGGWSALDWSPDDSTIVARQYLSINQSVLWMIDVAKGTKKELTDPKEVTAWSGAEYSADGASLYLTSDQGSEFQRLGKMDLKTGAIEWLTSDITWDVDGFDVSPDGKSLAFLVNEAGASRAFLLSTATGKYAAIEGLPAGVISGAAWHSNSNDIAFSVNSARSTSDVYSYTLDSKKIERWTESELGGLVPETLVEPELVRWKSFDGLEISGFLYRAPSKFSGKRPVIINIHGGPEGQSRPVFQGRNNFFLNELGVCILYPNVRGSSGYGKTFVALDNGFKREDSVKDIGALLDWIATQPDLDADRIMVTGGSYGGFMTLACATHYNDRIRCSLDVVGISHFGTFLKNTESYRRDLRRVEYGDERDPKMSSYFEEISPLNSARKIQKPLFVVQGGNDPRVPLSEAEQIVARVKQNGSPVWYLMAKDEGHGFRKKNNTDYQFFATIEFIRKFLLP
ncbi:MAG: S9 family peptidase [Planctomycetaceae bacterium]|nr:S9 family peptidase [Planctomycetaceae bacterium]